MTNTQGSGSNLEELLDYLDDSEGVLLFTYHGKVLDMALTARVHEKETDFQSSDIRHRGCYGLLRSASKKTDSIARLTGLSE